MKTTPKITFHNLDPSLALEKRIREKINKLEKKCDEIISCYVVVEAAHHHKTQGRLYSVRIDLKLPKGVFIVSTHPGKNPLKHDKVFAAMNNAFLAIEKQLKRYKELRRKDVKEHKEHWLSGEIKKLLPKKECGFIITPSELEVYFHKNSVSADRFLELKKGSKVRFVLAMDEGINGPQASIVRLSPKRKIKN